ncbi:hypothetical protein [Sporosarcina cascadiensis]|uniref:hypothetical protein n=1 Tax=Sporosarcina cascadiensis TaxID=2660747 RepID=UPI00129ABD21|nr:hypothetical protein [Sporosarcina cascadiensis]
MNAQELFKAINQCVDELDFISARKYMEQNKTLLQRGKHRLNRNAQELFQFVTDRGGEQLSQKDINMLHAINRYASNFDIRAFKLIVKDQAPLISRKDSLMYLNDDAKTLLESMNAVSVNA